MKKVIFGVLALILFLLVLNFGPNGLYYREQAITAEVAKARGNVGQTETLPPAIPITPAATDTASTAPGTPAPRVDTDTASPTPTPPSAPAATPAEAPATPAAPVEVAQATPPVPAADTTTTAPAAAPAPAVAATEPAPAPEPATPAPTAPIKPLPAVVTHEHEETPAVATATTAAPVVAPVVAAVPAPAAPRVRAKLNGPKVMVLGYYRFTEPGATGPNVNPNRLSGETFAKQLAWLRDNDFQVISLSQLVAHLKSGSPLPEHAVVITVNNGYNNAVTVAAPILHQFSFPWSFLVYTDFIEQSPKAVTWSNIIDLSKEGVEVGSQTKSHPWLTEPGSKTTEQYDKWLANELTGSRRMLELKLKQPITVLAYPYGNFNDTVEKKALSLGYDVLLNTSGEPVTSTTSPLRLGRLVMNQFTAPYFETILSQRDFRLTNTQPAVGTAIRDAHPVISATLQYAGRINPKSVQVELSSGGTYRNVYDPATKTISFPATKALLDGPVIVMIKAKDQDTGSPIAVYWQFYFQKPQS